MKEKARDITFNFLEKILRVILIFDRKKHTFVIKGLRLKFTLEEAFYNGILFYGVIDRYETKILKEILHKGDTVIDIGAYIDGWYSIYPSHLVGRGGHVYAFEPVPEYNKRLKENIKINHLTNINVFNKGIYDVSKTLPIYIEHGRSSLLKEQAESYIKKAVPKVHIKTITIDSFVKKNNLKKLNLIKIDVEGVEMNVLRGAKVTLRRFGPQLIIEMMDEQLKRGGTSEDEVISFLKTYGYVPYMFTSKGLQLYNSQRKLYSANILFTQKQG